jgi:hypothetical protein
MNPPIARNMNFSSVFQRVRMQRGLVFGAIIITALLAFEIFNYSTTDFALSDLLGDLDFAGVRWATILAIAFCGIDFAGIARLFTPETGADEPTEIWYLFGAWLLAATMNAMLTWWGVSIALLQHQSLGNAVIARDTLLRAVPIFVAVMVWLIRVLIIGTFSVAGERLFSQADVRVRTRSDFSFRNAGARQLAQNVKASAQGLQTFTPAPKPTQSEAVYTRPEPTYHPVSMQARSGNNHPNSVRR